MNGLKDQLADGIFRSVEHGGDVRVVEFLDISKVERFFLQRREYG